MKTQQGDLAAALSNLSFHRPWTRQPWAVVEVLDIAGSALGIGAESRVVLKAS